MSSVLGSLAGSRDNNFNLIRFVAASLVLYSHSFPLAMGRGAADPLAALTGMTAGGFAVDVFFVTSGFLVAGSLFNRHDIVAFAWARILRIYPGLIVATLFCVFVVGLLFTTETASDYFADPQTLKFLKRNMTLFWGVKYELPGVFEDLPFKGAVNGSLWTLPFEVKMYAYLACIAVVLIRLQKRIGREAVKTGFLLVAAAGLSVNVSNHFLQYASVNFWHLFSMFFLGTAFYVFRQRVYLSSGLFLVSVLTLLAAVADNDVFYVFYSVLLPYLVLYVAYVPSGAVRGFNRLGDYSYGMYIYAFPVQQSLKATLPGLSASGMTVLAFCLTLVLAFSSWHLVERRCLNMKGRYVRPEQFFRTLGRKAIGLWRKTWFRS